MRMFISYCFNTISYINIRLLTFLHLSFELRILSLTFARAMRISFQCAQRLFRNGNGPCTIITRNIRRCFRVKRRTLFPRPFRREKCINSKSTCFLTRDRPQRTCRRVLLMQLNAYCTSINSNMLPQVLKMISNGPLLAVLHHGQNDTTCRNRRYGRCVLRLFYRADYSLILPGQHSHY